MNVLSLTNNDLFSVSAVDYDEGMVQLSVIVPADLLPVCKSFLEFSNSLFSYTSTKAKYKKTIVDARSAEATQLRHESMEKFSKAVVSRYTDHMLSGLDRRAAINEIKRYYVDKGTDITCYQIELILRAAGCLSKKWVPHA